MGLFGLGPRGRARSGRRGWVVQTTSRSSF